VAFDVINPIDRSIVRRYLRGEFMDLPASKNIYIPALCMAMIPHTIIVYPAPDIPWGVEYHVHANNVEHNLGFIWISRIPGVFASHNLFIDSGQIVAGEVKTEVFNLSKNRVRIAEGQAISRLLAL